MLIRRPTLNPGIVNQTDVNFDMDTDPPENCRHTEDTDCLPHALPLSSDGDGAVNRTGYDSDYDGSPAGLLSCLPRRLCLLWVMEGMTQLQTKINRPYSDILLRKTMNGGGRRDVWISDTPPATHAVKGFSLALIGCRASVGGSVSLADWPCVLGAVDNPPGGVWIDFIRRTVEDSQSIVATPVTGSLVSPTLFSCRDANCTYRSSIFCVNCDTDWILPAGYQVLLLEHTESGTMDADGFSIVDNRACITLGVNTICTMGCAGDGDRSLVDRYCAATKRSGRFRDEWSSRQRDGESHSAREGRP